MPLYRAYIIGRDGHIAGFHVIDCANDQAAIQAAEQYVDGHDVEVWDEGRKITQLERKPGRPPNNTMSGTGHMV